MSALSAAQVANSTKSALFVSPGERRRWCCCCDDAISFFFLQLYYYILTLVENTCAHHVETAKAADGALTHLPKGGPRSDANYQNYRKCYFLLRHFSRRYWIEQTSYAVVIPAGLAATGFLGQTIKTSFAHVLLNRTTSQWQQAEATTKRFLFNFVTRVADFARRWNSSLLQKILLSGLDSIYMTSWVGFMQCILKEEMSDSGQKSCQYYLQVCNSIFLILSRSRIWAICPQN